MVQISAGNNPDTPKVPEYKRKTTADDVQGVAGQRLKSMIERIERLEEEKRGMAEDIKEIYAEAKGTGFDPEIIHKIVRLRKMDIEKRREADMLLETYKAALGME